MTIAMIKRIKSIPAITKTILFARFLSFGARFNLVPLSSYVIQNRLRATQGTYKPSKSCANYHTYPRDAGLKARQVSRC